MKFVIILKVERDSGFSTSSPSGKFYWEVRELTRRDESTTDLLERTGPALATGVAVDNASARAAAEEAARMLASEDIYIYDTP